LFYLLSHLGLLVVKKQAKPYHLDMDQLQSQLENLPILSGISLKQLQRFSSNSLQNLQKLLESE